MWLAFVAVEVSFIMSVDLYVLIFVYGHHDPPLPFPHIAYLQYAFLALYVALAVLFFTIHAVSYNGWGALSPSPSLFVYCYYGIFFFFFSLLSLLT
jgi:hypothetical protein